MQNQGCEMFISVFNPFQIKWLNMTDVTSFYADGTSLPDSVIHNCRYQTLEIKCPKIKMVSTTLGYCYTLLNGSDAPPVTTEIAGFPNVFSFEYDTQQDEYSIPQMQLSGGAGARVNTDTILHPSLDSNELALHH